MTRTRRTAVLLIAAAAVLLGLISPAEAKLADSASAPTMSITAVDVLAPTKLSFAGTTCTTTWNGWTYVTTLHAKVSWTASPTRGVTGYAVTAVFADGTRYFVSQVDASATSLKGDYDASIVANNDIRVAITTLTSYGWTEESTTSGVIKC